VRYAPFHRGGTGVKLIVFQIKTDCDSVTKTGTAEGCARPQPCARSGAGE
jgi:hypothetical protein